MCTIFEGIPTKIKVSGPTQTNPLKKASVEVAYRVSGSVFRFFRTFFCMERTIAYQLQSCSYLVQTTSGSPIMESVMRRSYIPLFIPHCPSPSLGPVQNTEILLFEKIENLEIHFEKIKILFSLQNLLKVRGSAVILRY